MKKMLVLILIIACSFLQVNALPSHSALNLYYHGIISSPYKNVFDLREDVILTRQEFAVTLTKLLKSFDEAKDFKGKFAFVDKNAISSWTLPFVSYCHNKQFLSDTKGYFWPKRMLYAKELGYAIFKMMNLPVSQDNVFQLFKKHGLKIEGPKLTRALAYSFIWKAISEIKDESGDNYLKRKGFIKALEEAEIGDKVMFGHYEQDNNPQNGKEEITWLVLDKNQDYLVLISAFGLDSLPYSDKYAYITWEKTSLREWLNKEFYYSAFDENERKSIINEPITNKNNPKWNTDGGNPTQDYVYILSFDEIADYSMNPEDLRLKPTAYAVGRGAFLSQSSGSANGNSFWVLRTPGGKPYYVTFVHPSGAPDTFGWNNNTDKLAIRPVVRVKYGHFDGE